MEMDIFHLYQSRQSFDPVLIDIPHTRQILETLMPNKLRRSNTIRDKNQQLINKTKVLFKDL